MGYQSKSPRSGRKKDAPGDRPCATRWLDCSLLSLFLHHRFHASHCHPLLYIHIQQCLLHLLDPQEKLNGRKAGVEVSRASTEGRLQAREKSLLKELLSE